MVRMADERVQCLASSPGRDEPHTAGMSHVKSILSFTIVILITLSVLFDMHTAANLNRSASNADLRHEAAHHAGREGLQPRASSAVSEG